jgi:hypothetical protein
MPEYSKSFDLPGYSHGKLTDAAKATTADLAGSKPPGASGGGTGGSKKNSKKSKKKSKSTGY